MLNGLDARFKQSLQPTINHLRKISNPRLRPAVSTGGLTAAIAASGQSQSRPPVQLSWSLP